jgi:type I restriction-modification system DNA methylase subunit
VYDPCCGTGGFLVAGKKHFPEAQVCGGEIEKNAYRLALVNMLLHDFSANINYGDSLVIPESK